MLDSLKRYFFSKSWRDSRDGPAGLGGFLFLIFTSFHTPTNVILTKVLSVLLAAMSFIDGASKLVSNVASEKLSAVTQTETESYYAAVLNKILDTLPDEEKQIENKDLNKIKARLGDLREIDPAHAESIIDDLYALTHSNVEAFSYLMKGLISGLSCIGNHFIELNVLVSFGEVKVFDGDNMKPIYTLTLLLAAFASYHGILRAWERSTPTVMEKVSYLYGLLSMFSGGERNEDAEILPPAEVRELASPMLGGGINE